MIEDLLPSNIEKLRELYRTVYAERPVLLIALEDVLDGLKEVWGNQGTFKKTADRLNEEVLPLLLEVADILLSGPSRDEEAIAHVVQEWRRIASTLEHP
jgi:hypothetical protein